MEITSTIDAKMRGADRGREYHCSPNAGPHVTPLLTNSIAGENHNHWQAAAMLLHDTG